MSSARRAKESQNKLRVLPTTLYPHAVSVNDLPADLIKNPVKNPAHSLLGPFGLTELKILLGW